MTHSNALTRREFLLKTGAAATAISPASFAQAPMEENNLYAILARHKPRDQQGNVVSASANVLQQKYGNKFATLSATYLGCANGYCQKTNQELSALDPNAANVTHFILSLNPEFDGGFTKAQGPSGHQGERNNLERFVSGYLKKKNFVLLYPSSPLEAKTMLEATKRSIQTRDDDPTHHTPDIILFAPGGAVMDKKNGYTQSLDSWLDKTKGTGVTR